MSKFCSCPLIPRVCFNFLIKALFERGRLITAVNDYNMPFKSENLDVIQGNQ